MKHATKALAILLIFCLSLSLSGCSKEKLLEKGVGILDDMFAGLFEDTDLSPGISPTTPNQPSVDSSQFPSNPEPSSSEPIPGNPPAEEPDIPDTDKPVVPDRSPAQSPAEPNASQSTPTQTNPSTPTTSSKSPETSTTPSVSPETSKPAASEEIKPSHTDATLFKAGETFRYKPEGLSGTYTCEYSSDNESIAKIDPKTGTVTAVAPGTTKVKMSVEYNGNYKFECIVRCSWKEDGKTSGSSEGNGGKKPGDTSDKKGDEPKLPSTSSGTPTQPPSDPTSLGISASHSDATFFGPKEFFKFKPIGATDDSTVTYSTSDKDVATVDSNGKVTAVGPGKATVTMTVDCGGSDYIFKCVVRCNWES